MQLNVENPVVVMFMTMNRMSHGIAGPFAGRTVSQVKFEIRSEACVLRDTPAVLNGHPVFRKREKGVYLKPGDELWLGGWNPPSP